MIQAGLFDAPAPAQDLQQGERLVNHRSRPCRFHRDCGDHVFLKALDAGIGGPFYWVKKAEVRGV